VVKIAKNEVTMENLLNMSAQQLSDPTLQELRQKQFSASVEDVQRPSMEQELENKRRSTMANQSEVWRGGSTLEVADSLMMNTMPEETKKKSASHPSLKDINRNASTDSTASEIEMLDQSLLPTDLSSNSRDLAEENLVALDGPTQRSLQIEQRALAAAKAGSGKFSSKTAEPVARGVTTKRPIDADAMTRLTTTTNPKPHKIPKLNEFDDTGDYNNQDSTSTTSQFPESPKAGSSNNSSTMDLDSPKHHKAPTLLELLKASAKKSNESEESTPTITAASTPVVSQSSSAKEIPKPAEKQQQQQQLKPVTKSAEPSSSSSKAPSQAVISGSGARYEPSTSYVPIMRLLNKDNSDCVTISRMKDINMRTTAMTNDK
jgi:hypothetical protein